MRKALIIVSLALLSFGFSSAALAKNNCKQVMGSCMGRCMEKYGANAATFIECGDGCDLARRLCEFSNAATFNSHEACKNNKCGQDDSSDPDFGHEKSHPKQVDGKTQRTADGRTIMVTPEGKEWVWNGKYNTVATYERNGVIGEYHSVMQGDPDAPWRMVNGKNMQVSDPRYQAEADAAVAKQKAEQDAKNAAAQKAASKQTKDSIDAAKGSDGILKRDGTKIIKEDVDAPPKTGSNSTSSNAAMGTQPSTASKAVTSAQPSTANPVSTTAAASGAGSVKNKPPAVSTPVIPPSLPSAPSGSAARHAQ